MSFLNNKTNETNQRAAKYDALKNYEKPILGGYIHIVDQLMSNTSKQALRVPLTDTVEHVAYESPRNENYVPKHNNEQPVAVQATPSPQRYESQAVEAAQPSADVEESENTEALERAYKLLGDIGYGKEPQDA
jgi:hypothetical protein